MDNETERIRRLAGSRQAEFPEKIEGLLLQVATSQEAIALQEAQVLSEEKQAEAALRLHSQVLQRIAEGVSLSNEDGVIVYTNPAADVMFGCEPGELIGQYIISLNNYSPEENAQKVNAVRAQLKLQETWSGEFSNRRKDGMPFTTFARITSMEMTNQRYWVWVQEDITERKRTEDNRLRLLALEQTARLQAEAANRAKDEFLATVSHELRAPLNAILGWTRLLRAGKLSAAEITRALETVEQSARLQNQLINDLLDISRIIVGKFRFEVRPVELPSVVEVAVEAARPAAEAKQISIQIALDPRVRTVSGDPDRLQQVVGNLLSNAIKFTPQGGRIQVRLGRADSHAEITVSDTGAGISPDFLPYVFDRFRQSDSSSNKKLGGLGLGLAIVRHLVELHGGTIHAQSHGKGQGATFVVKLPLLANRFELNQIERVHPKAEGRAAFDVPFSLSGLRILVVDDEADAQELLTAILTQYAADVRTAASVAEALMTLAEWWPDLLISDIEMPDTDGYSLIRQVRALEAERGKEIPVVALTAHARVEDRMRALATGFQVHVSKPVEPAELAMVVASLAGRIGKGVNV